VQSARCLFWSVALVAVAIGCGDHRNRDDTQTAPVSVSSTQKCVALMKAACGRSREVGRANACFSSQEAEMTFAGQCEFEAADAVCRGVTGVKAGYELCLDLVGKAPGSCDEVDRPEITMPKACDDVFVRSSQMPPDTGSSAGRGADAGSAGRGADADGGAMTKSLCVRGGFLDLRNGTVADCEAAGGPGLLWQQAVGPRTTWSAAKMQCADLELAGSKGWRVPTLQELQTIVCITCTLDVRGNQHPSVNSGLFPDTPPAQFWTSTDSNIEGKSLWTIDFASGDPVAAASVIIASHHVRCVRDAVVDATRPASGGNTIVAGAAAPPAPSSGGMTGTANRPVAGALSRAGGPAPGDALPCNVASIVTSRCQTCHGSTPTDGAPMSLMAASDFSANAPTQPSMRVAQVAITRINSTSSPMPPVSNPSLVDEEKQTLVSWLSGGALGTQGSCP
jgi:hypothetical protein